ncbi:MAG: hypothetical protein LUE99_02980 [Bacteroides sp.]|nr:hypothetical protein [Bacteroides sp.]
MSPNYCPEKGSEYARLQSLYRKLKQFINVLQLLSMHEWGKGILEIQNAEGIYMLQSNIDRKILLQTHQEIGLHLQFITQLAGNMSFVKQLLGILQCHYHNVEYLIKNMESSKNL